MTDSLDRDARPSLLSFLVRRIRQDLQFSGIFTCDFVACASYVAVTFYLFDAVSLPRSALADMAGLAAAFIVLHVLKIFMVFFLERQGGDAREFVGSKRLVTEGIYKFSRNPVYVMSMAQSLTWSLLLLRGGLAAAVDPVCVAAAAMIPIGHFLSIDLWIIPNEEAALKRAHPKAFADYARRVNRWLGRRDAAD